MALTLNDNWKRAVMRSGAEIRYHVTIDLGGGTTYEAVDGDLDVVNQPDVGIVRVDPLVQEIKPFNRNLQISAIYVSCFDAWLRPILVSQRIKNQRVTITIGERSLALSDFEPYYDGIVHGVEIQPGGTTITLLCLDLFAMLRQRKVTGSWTQIHPLTAILDILDKVGIPASLIDATSFDPDVAANAAVGHFVINRGGVSWSDMDTAVKSPTDALTLVNELLMMMQGSIVITEAGQLQFKLFDPAAAAVAAWDDDVIGDFVQEVLDENVINRVTLGFAGFPMEYEQVYLEPGDGNLPPRHNWITKTARGFQYDDTVSQATYEHPDSTEGGVFEFKAILSWLNNDLNIRSSYASGDSSINLTMAAQSFCGTREIDPFRWPLGQPANAQLSGARPGYAYVNGEILKITALALDSTYSHYIALEQQDLDTRDQIQQSVAADVARLTATVTRAQFSTTALDFDVDSATDDWSWDHALDLTIPVYMAQKIIERYAFGAFVVRLKTSILEFDKQVLDLVTLDNPNFVGLGLNGVTALAGKWEILSKKVSTYDGPPAIEWQLMFIPAYTANPAIRNWSTAHRHDVNAARYEESRDATIGQQFISYGFDMTDGGGLDLDISPGRAKSLLRTITFRNTTTFTLPDLSDCYVYFGLEKAAIIIIAIGNSGTAPDRPRDALYLGRVITDATSITSIEQDKRPYIGNVVVQPFNGNRIQENTLGQGSLNTLTRSATATRDVVSNADFGAFSREPDYFGGFR